MTTVTSQITDAITQTNVKVVGESPDMSDSAFTQAPEYSDWIALKNVISAEHLNSGEETPSE